jgi:hypothetical protein
LVAAACCVNRANDGENDDGRADDGDPPCASDAERWAYGADAFTVARCLIYARGTLKQKSEDDNHDCRAHSQNEPTDNVAQTRGTFMIDSKHRFALMNNGPDIT